MELIEEKVKQLPQELQQEVLDFIDFLIAKKRAKRDKKRNQNWIG